MSNENKFLNKIIEDQRRQLQESEDRIDELRQVISQQNTKITNFQYQNSYEESMKQKLKNANIELQKANEKITKLQEHIILNIILK